MRTWAILKTKTIYGATYPENFATISVIGEHFDVVAFTHLDRDHYAGATEFFYFEHTKKYQGDVDGKRRIKMDEMWVPAAVITESFSADADVEAKAIQKEARERFKTKSGIRVFSRPERLREWCTRNEVDLEDRKQLVTDAGELVPGLNLAEDDVEFFVHSPFAIRQDENTIEDRNGERARDARDREGWRP